VTATFAIQQLSVAHFLITEALLTGSSFADTVNGQIGVGQEGDLMVSRVSGLTSRVISGVLRDCQMETKLDWEYHTVSRVCLFTLGKG
jgi:hypothetical protein